MPVLVQGFVQQISQQLLTMIKGTYEDERDCGVMLTTCSNMSPRMVDQLQTYLNQSEPNLSVQYLFDDEHRILGVLLENEKLVSTHYISLLFKEFLDRHDLREGQIVVASFPESGAPTKKKISQFIGTVTESRHQEGDQDIILFMNAETHQGIRSILVADTEEVSREFVKLRLELKGYEVYEAKDGSEALDKYFRLSPDLVITELTLPIIDGYQVIHKVMEEQSRGGKVIVLTDKQLTKDMNRAFELGASDYVTKPFSISELEWRIKKLQMN